jgi:hypothetical protein
VYAVVDSKLFSYDYDPGRGVCRGNVHRLTVHDDKAEGVVVRKKRDEGFCVELVVTEIQRRVDSLERLEVDVNFLFLALVCHNRSTVQHETVGRDFDSKNKLT